MVAQGHQRAGGRRGAIEEFFNDHFDAHGLAYEPTPFDGRSDYGPFIAEGIDVVLCANVIVAAAAASDIWSSASSLMFAIVSQAWW